jgi:hypothetical protein
MEDPVDEGLARRLAKAGARLGVGGVLLLLLTAIFTGLQGPHWRPVMMFGIALIVAGFGFMGVLLIRLRMILNSEGDIEEYRDIFGNVRTRPKAPPPKSGIVGPDKPESRESPEPKVGKWKGLRRRIRRHTRLKRRDPRGGQPGDDRDA